MAKNMRMLTWDDDLARTAQRWADQCIRGHDKSRIIDGHKFVGQNIAYKSSSRLTDDVRDYDLMVKAWYDEVRNFPVETVNDFSLNPSAAKGKTIGHYTALVWGETSKIGCGYIHYLSKTVPTVPYEQVLVCNYAEGGNVRGRSVYEVAASASEIGSGCDSRSHDDGLCN